MSAGITIRPARASDYEAIVDLWIASGLPASTAGRDGRGAFRTQLRQFPTSYLVAEREGLLVGVILGTHDHRKGWINRIAVHPDHRRRGLGGDLMAACERAFMALGIEIFAALVEADNADSISAFRAVGYKSDIPVVYFHKRLRPDV